MSALRFDGRVAVITGAGRGVGRCHANAGGGQGRSYRVANYGVAIDATVRHPRRLRTSLPNTAAIEQGAASD